MMATRFPMNAARQAFRDCFKTAAAPQLSAKAQSTSTTLAGTNHRLVQRPDCNAGVLQRAEHEDGCIA
jgi:hypothetical protein